MTGPDIRRRVERAIDALIDLLDAIDGDADLEPTLGFIVAGHLDEAEPDYDNEEDDPPEYDLRNAPRRLPKGQQIFGRSR